MPGRRSCPANQTSEAVVEVPQPQDAGFPREFLSVGERILIELKPRVAPFLVAPLSSLSILFLFFPMLLLLWGTRDLLLLLTILGYLLIPVMAIIAILVPVNYFRWKATFYAVTDRRIMSVTGLIGRSFVDMPHDKVQNVTLSQNAFQKWVGYASLIFASAGTGAGSATPRPSAARIYSGTLVGMGNVVFLGVPRPVAVRKRAQDIIQQSQDQVKAKDYRKMAETFKEVGESPLQTVAAKPVVTVTERNVAKFCEYCGAPVEGVPRFCEGCGNRIN